MNTKRKGTVAERELIKSFWDAGWACMRSAGSGSNQYPCPDVIAGRNGVILAIEAKMVNGTSKYFPASEIEDLILFAGIFGAQPWIAVKFQKYKFYFLSIEALKKTANGYSIQLRDCEQRGLTFEELVTQYSN